MCDIAEKTNYLIKQSFKKVMCRFRERRQKKLASFVVGHQVLDVGYVDAPNKFLRGSYVVGYDIAKPNDSVCYDEVIQGDIADITSVFKGYKFDTIILGEVIEHLESPYQALRDLKSLMTDNSRLILSTPNPLSFPVLFFEFLNSKRFFYTKSHLYYFCPRWVERMLDVVGFDLEKVVPMGLYFLPIPVPKNLSYILIYTARKKHQNVE